MAEHLFLRTTIAIIWDFDSTLIPGYMQEPLFRRFDVDANQFWKETNALSQFYREHGVTRVSKDALYLNHILSYVKAGVFAGLDNRMLRDLGKEIKFYPGLPDFLPQIKERIANNSLYSKHQINVEHYVVSTGLREMIMGSAVAPYLDEVWACEFAESSAEPGYLDKEKTLFAAGNGVICEIAYSLDNTSKTRAIFEINKGCNKIAEIDVNATIDEEIRRVPFQNMLYIADGPSDVPCFSLVGHSGGRTYAVYRAKSDAEFQKAYDLQKQHRVEAFGEADYSDGSHTAMWITKAVEDIAQRIVRDRTRMLGDELGRPPGHVLEPTPPARTVVTSDAGNLRKVAAVADDSSAPKKVPARVEAGSKQESSDAVTR